MLCVVLCGVIMTSPPVTQDDVVQGCCKWLLSLSDVVAAVGSSDGVPSIFQDVLQRNMEQTQEVAAVISVVGGWGAPNDYNSLRLPRLQVELYVDAWRSGDRSYVELAESRRRAYAVFDIFDRHLHRPSHEMVMWGTVRTINCVRLGEPVVAPVPDGDGMVKSMVFYGVMVG
jgi:hypothetical protein